MSALAVVGSPIAAEWSVESRPLPGQFVSGDLHVVAPTAGGGVTVAVIDGLGHGPEAADAAEIAATTLAEFADEPVIELVRRCHLAMRRSRGAAISIAQFDVRHDTMTWIGVGNVEAVLFRATPGEAPALETLLLRGGVVGYQLPPLRAATLPVAPGDMLILATDGVDRSFRHRPIARQSPQDIARRILSDHAKSFDDALVLVTRYHGHPQ